MKRLRKSLSVLMVLAMLMLPMAALAATDNPSPASPGYFIMPFHLTGALTAGTITGVVSFNMPFPAKLLGVYASCRAHTGTQTINVLVAGTSMLSSVISLVTAGIVYEGTIAPAAALIADEAAITIDLVTNTTVTDTTILLVLKRQ
jgi:hypothetical protein